MANPSGRILEEFRDNVVRTCGLVSLAGSHGAFNVTQGRQHLEEFSLREMLILNL